MTFEKYIQKHKLRATECKLDGTETQLYPAYAIVKDGHFLAGSLADIGRAYSIDINIANVNNETVLFADDGDVSTVIIMLKDKTISLEQAYALYTAEILMNCNGQTDYKIYGLTETA